MKYQTWHKKVIKWRFMIHDNLYPVFKFDMPSYNWICHLHQWKQQWQSEYKQVVAKHLKPCQEAKNWIIYCLMRLFWYVLRARFCVGWHGWDIVLTFTTDGHAISYFLWCWFYPSPTHTYTYITWFIQWYVRMLYSSDHNAPYK